MEMTYDYFNKRLRLNDFSGNPSHIINKLQTLITENQFEKVICYVRKEQMFTFIAGGFHLEAIVQKYFSGSDAYIMTKYPKTERRNSQTWSAEDKILSDIKQKTIVKKTSRPSEYTLRKANESDAEKLAHMYSTVFKIYPTPLINPDYIKTSIDNGNIFYYIKNDSGIVSAASADINFKYYNAELTDCATIPAFRKYGFMKLLLTKLELELLNKQIYCVYSIARSLSYGMNACFHQLGYTYTGRLANNCYIFDKLEDMNVWSKDLSITAEKSAEDA
nr:putative beta-lysine N-acetyltransferase [Bacillus sp. PS06]